MSKCSLFLLPALKLSKTDISKTKKKSVKNSQHTWSIFLTLGHIAAIYFAGNSKEHLSTEGPRCSLVPHPGEHHILGHPRYRGQLLSLILVTVYANKECPSTLKQSMPLAIPCHSCLPKSEHAQMQLPSISWQAGCQQHLTIQLQSWKAEGQQLCQNRCQQPSHCCLELRLQSTRPALSPQESHSHASPRPISTHLLPALSTWPRMRRSLYFSNCEHLPYPPRLVSNTSYFQPDTLLLERHTGLCRNQSRYKAPRWLSPCLDPGLKSFWRMNH